MPKPKKSRILIVDDNPSLREGLRAVFQTSNDLAVCGEAENSLQAVAAVKKLKPDLAIVDVSLRMDDGIELTRQLHEQWPALPVLVFSLHEEQAYCDKALAAGARGYCTKANSGEHLFEIVRQPCAGMRAGDGGKGSITRHAASFTTRSDYAAFRSSLSEEPDISFASLFTVSAILLSFSSAAFSSSNVCWRRSTASVSPRVSAQARRQPYAAIS